MTPEDKILIARYEDKANQCSENSMITCTPFLDMREHSVIASHLVSKNEAKTVFYGVFEDAERTAAVMLPYYVEADDFESLCNYFRENPDDNPLAVIEVEKDRFSPPLSHRDYLGALMSLGIRREVTGDIVITENTLCVVPALLFSRDGYRLGYGKGYYDRFLRSFNGTSVGLSYDELLCEYLPIDSHDISLNIIITESEVHYIAQKN